MELNDCEADPALSGDGPVYRLDNKRNQCLPTDSNRKLITALNRPAGFLYFIKPNMHLKNNFVETFVLFIDLNKISNIFSVLSDFIARKYRRYVGYLARREKRSNLFN